MSAVLTLAAAAACQPSTADLEWAIYRLGRAWPHQRAGIARRLAPLVTREARRRRLGALTIVAIGSTETDFRPWMRGPHGEIGVWQLKFRDSPVDAAARSYRSEAPALARRRRYRPPGHWWFSRWELGTYEIGTYVLAREVAYHVAYCRRRHRMAHGGRWALWRRKWWAKRWRVDLALFDHLVRVAHYNIGPRPPLWYYVKRLIGRYRRAYYWACKRRPRWVLKRHCTGSFSFWGLWPLPWAPHCLARSSPR